MANKLCDYDLGKFRAQHCLRELCPVDEVDEKASNQSRLWYLEMK